MIGGTIQAAYCKCNYNLEGEKRMRDKIVFEEIMAEHFPYLIKTTHLEIQEAQELLSTKGIKKIYLKVHNNQIIQNQRFFKKP